MTSLRHNGIQFAVVREDAEIEIELIKKYRIESPILVASGGCTAFNISSAYPDICLSLMEPNGFQIELIKKKASILRTQDVVKISERFGLTRSDAKNESLIESGNFESLFRQFRAFVFEFVADRDQIRRLILGGPISSWKELFKHPYWKAAFDLFFSDSMLRTMFGDLAIQHAPKGSYPMYFRNVIEGGLLRWDRSNNYFLHHILLGHYFNKKTALPRYLKKPPKKMNYQFINEFALDVRSYSEFDFIGLSNIFDWSSEKQVSLLANKLLKELRPGSLILFRQLNSNKNFTKYFKTEVVWKENLAKKLYAADRSLFYQALHIGVRK